MSKLETYLKEVEERLVGATGYDSWCMCGSYHCKQCRGQERFDDNSAKDVEALLKIVKNLRSELNAAVKLYTTKFYDVDKAIEPLLPKESEASKERRND